MVDEKRIEELIAKRHETGLSDDEADELGKLFAEKEGKPYSNAKLSKLPPGERGKDVPAEATQTAQQPPEPRPTDVASQEPQTPAP
jgi:hypothetical protein